jgi:hypothetical protein
MFSKADATRVMEKIDSRGSRVPFHVKFCTAVRHNWLIKKKLRKRLALMDKDDPEYKKLEERIANLDVGGRWIEHDKVILPGTRGMHAKKEKEQKKAPLKKPNLYTNRNRNLKFLPSGQIRQAHLSLIVRVNHTVVLY